MLVGFTTDRMFSVDQNVTIIRLAEEISVTVFLIPLIHGCKAFSKVEDEETVEKTYYL